MVPASCMFLFFGFVLVLVFFFSRLRKVGPGFHAGTRRGRSSSLRIYYVRTVTAEDGGRCMYVCRRPSKRMCVCVCGDEEKEKEKEKNGERRSEFS